MFQLPGQIVFGVASQLALILLAATAVVLAIHGQLSPAEAIAVIVVIVRYLEPFTVLAELSSGVESVVNTLQQIRSVFEAPIADSGRLSHRYQHAPTIELRDVCVSVTADQPVLSGINLAVCGGYNHRHNRPFRIGEKHAAFGDRRAKTTNKRRRAL